MLLSIASVLLLLGVLIFFHELGHYAVARFVGIGVEIFSIGFGPRLLGIRRGGTDYRVSAIPLGGFVKFHGALAGEPVASDRVGMLYREASWWARAWVVVAGPAANMILAVVAFMILGGLGVERVPAVVGDVIAGSPAEQAGLTFGDEVLAIDQHPVRDWQDLNQTMTRSAGQPLVLTVRRGEKVFEMSITPASVDARDELGRERRAGRIGISRAALPAILALPNPIGPAARAGLVTGQRIRAVSIDGGKTYREVKYFVDWMFALRDLASQATTNSVAVWIQVEGGPQGATWTGVLQAPAGATSPKQLSHDLGIVDAQLVVREKGPEVRGDLRPGDRILRWNGASVESMFQLHEQLLKQSQSQAQVAVMGADWVVREVDLNLTARTVPGPLGTETVYPLDAKFVAEHEPLANPVDVYPFLAPALGFGIRATMRKTGELADGTWRLVTGDIPLKALGGPILIAKVASDSARRGLATFVETMAIISINLALINMFPIPALDGGQLIMCLVEGVRRRPLREKAVEAMQRLGFVMIICLLVMATYNDISRFWRSMLQTMTGNP